MVHIFRRYCRELGSFRGDTVHIFGFQNISKRGSWRGGETCQFVEVTSGFRVYFLVQLTSYASLGNFLMFLA